MAVPKRKVSKMRVRQRKASHPVQSTSPSACPKCGALRLSHRVCGSCGYYRGRQVLTIETA